MCLLNLTRYAKSYLETCGDKNMRKAITIGVIGFGLLAGCGDTTNVNYMYRDKPTTKSQKARDILSCEVFASKEVAVSNQTSTTPVFTTPTYTTPVSCYTGYGGYTSCTGGQTMGGQTYGGNLVTTDTNAGLRKRVVAQCLSNKGYKTTPFPVPFCAKDQIPSGYVTSKTILQKPVDGACAIDPVEPSGGSVILLPKDQLKPNKS